MTAAYIEQKLKAKSDGQKCNVWIPGKDSGIDLLVTNSGNKKTCSLQVKYSKDFWGELSKGDAAYSSQLLACGWWVLNRNKIQNSKADFWVFALVPLNTKDLRFLVISPKDLLSALDDIHNQLDRFNIYFWVTKGKEEYCIETRELDKKDKDFFGALTFFGG